MNATNATQPRVRISGLRTDALILDVLVILLFASFTGALLQPALLSSPELPTGGDMASHVLYAWLFDQVVAPSGQLTAWLPEVFGGYPLHSYYFPLPFLAITLLAKALGFAAGFKWAVVLPALLLPGTVFAVSRRALKFSGLAAFGGALGAFAFLVHEQNSIWGGNLLSLLAGEFAYSWGLWLAFAALAAWARVANDGRGWVVAAVLEALTGLGHGYPLLVAGFASWLLLVDAPSRRTLATALLKGHTLAFLLLGGWLWPMLEMHGFTIPNDGAGEVISWQTLLPKTLWPVLGGGLLALPLALRRAGSATARTTLFFLMTAALAALLGLVAGRVGLLDIRFFPMAWLFGGVAGGWMVGSALERCPPGMSRPLLALALLFALLGWLAPLVRQAPEWAAWNFSGAARKPQWHTLAALFPAMAGQLDSPRLLFEHDPDNEDLGSTRTLEALPMFLNGRPVLEGLYMESALLGPAVYQLQSEVSARPSSPLVRFPSGRLDPALAARHMRMLRSDQVLLRSAAAKQALLASGLFEPVAENPPFLLLRLKSFDAALVDGSSHPWRIRPRRDWMQDSHAWFRSERKLAGEWPVYLDHPSPETVRTFSADYPPARIERLKVTREAVSFTTSAPGRPHLIKMTYHPRWRLETKGEVFLAAPGFLLVVPGEASVRLVYGTTAVGLAGECASLVAALYLVYCLLRRRKSAVPAHAPASVDFRRWGAMAAAMAAGCVWLHATSPNRVYFDGWKAMNAQRYAEAAERFLAAYPRRPSPAAQEEALFWAAKALENAQQPAQAVERYRELFDRFHGYWVAESLYSYARLNRGLGHVALARRAEERLRQDYPQNEWTLKAVPQDGRRQ